MDDKNPAQISIKLLLRLVIRMALFAVAILWPAGTVAWWEAWAVIAIWTLFSLVMTVYLSRYDPALLAERMRLLPLQKDQKTWDRAMMLLFTIAGITLYITPGLDVLRFNWTTPLPSWIEIIAMSIQFPCFVALWWVMRENTFLSQVVKIDNKRDHKVITTGPYRFVRHPMYAVMIVLLITFPLALGSRIALIPAIFLLLLLIVRTYFEDRTLHDELEGYSDYARQTAFRLIPGVW